MVKILVVNEFHEDIYAMVIGDKKLSSGTNIHAALKLSLAAVEVAVDKKSEWESVSETGFTKIQSNSATPFFPIADKDTVYVTIFIGVKKEIVCNFHPIQADKYCNVKLNAGGYICISFSKADICKYESLEKTDCNEITNGVDSDGQDNNRNLKRKRHS